MIDVDRNALWLPPALAESTLYFETRYSEVRKGKKFSIPENATLTQAKLSRANLSEAELSYATLARADLSYANLTSANLSHANLSIAALPGSDLTKACLHYASLHKAYLYNATLREANLNRANLRGADLTSSQLISANLSGANLHRATLTNADLTNADLYNADLYNANLCGANLTQVCLWDTTGNGREVISIQTRKYKCAYTSEILQIGCKRHLIKDWWEFDDSTIDEMDYGALSWWKAHKRLLQDFIAANPAQLTGHESQSNLPTESRVDS